MEKKGLRLPSLRGGYKTDLDLIDKLITVYALMKDIKLVPYEKNILKYYIKYGYSLDVRDMIVEDLGKNLNTVKVTETSLRHKGLLVKGVNNERKSELSEDMKKLKKDFIDKKNKTLVLLFQK